MNYSVSFDVKNRYYISEEAKYIQQFPFTSGIKNHSAATTAWTTTAWWCISATHNNYEYLSFRRLFSYESVLDTLTGEPRLASPRSSSLTNTGKCSPKLSGLESTTVERISCRERMVSWLRLSAGETSSQSLVSRTATKKIHVLINFVCSQDVPGWIGNCMKILLKSKKLGLVLLNFAKFRIIH